MADPTLSSHHASIRVVVDSMVVDVVGDSPMGAINLHPLLLVRGR